MNMKKSKKLLSIILALGMMLSLLPVTALAVVPPLTVGTGGDYATLTAALSDAADGDTILLLNDITESVNYTVTTDKTITIDGDGHTITGVDGNASIALSLSGEGNIILEDINILGGLGGSASADASTGLYVTDTLNVQSVGTVTAAGGTDKYSCGLYHNGSGAVDLTAATGQKYGVNINGTGTVNMNAATGTAGIIENYGVFNNSSGTINVTTATGSNVSGIGVVNWGTGTVNATTATGRAFGVYNSAAGTVNAAAISGTTSGTVNTGANVAILTLNKGADASCVLDSITVAASGSTTIGTLPGAYKDGVAGEWYTDVDKDALFSGTTVTAATTLYSTYCNSVSGTILDNVTGAGLAATLQLKDSSDNNVGNAVTAAADGSYTISNVPAGTGYTILVTMSGYADGIITAFDVEDTNVTALDLTLHSLSVGTGCNTLSDALASAGDGDTVTLVSNITECAAYTGTAGKTVTIDGQGYTVTGAAVSNSVALTLSGEGTVILKDLTLQGGDSSEAFALSVGLQVNNSLDVRSLGTVAVKGGAAQMSYGLNHSGTGTVDVTEASAVGTFMGAGVVNNSSGTVNVRTAACDDAFGTGAVNSGAGTINVTTATGGAEGANNQIDGTINVTTVTGSQFGVSNMSTGTINVTTVTATDLSGVAVNNSGGTVNAGTINGTVTGTANTDIAAVTLNKGSGASCVLDSITVAADTTVNTTVGSLPSVFKDGAYSNTWYKDSLKNTEFSGITVKGAMTLYSDYYNAVAKITKDSTTTYYETLTDALTAAAGGDTVTLLGDITECATYIGTVIKTVTIDGQNHTVTGVEGSESIALSLSGVGTVILKNLTLRGGTYTSLSASSVGLRVGGTLDIRSDGTVSVYGGTTAANGFGLANYSVGTVDVTTASASGSNIGIGVANYTTGTVNVSTAEGSGIQGTGVFNQSSGTVNVTTATGIFYGVLNQSTGTVNGTTATATGLGGTAVSNGSGTVNAGTITGSTVGSGTINTGTDVAAVTLKAGTGASCVLDSITVAASGDTTIGALPGVYKDGAYSDNWYTDNAKTSTFSETYVTGATTLLSDYYELVPINTASIAGVTAPAKNAAPTSSIADTAEYTATISWSPADAAFAASTVYTATITITPKTGYTLTDVAANFFTVAGATVTNAANSGVVTAVFPATASSGGGGGSISSDTSSRSTITITTEGSVTTGTASLTGTTSGGSQTVSVPGDTMTSLTEAAQEAETAGNAAIVQIDMGSGLENVGVTLPGTQFDSLASGTDAALQFSTGIGSVTFSADAVNAIAAAGSGDVTFSIGTADTSTLTPEQQATVVDRPVYSFSVTVGETTVSEFGSAVTVSLPYTLQDGENPNAIVVYYVDVLGNLQLMQGAYDETTGMVTFETSHFSEYVIGYNEVTFTDVAETAWYADAVTFLAARGITTGITATTFGPNATLTRGQFIVMLMRAYGIDADSSPTDNFSDAGNTYYTGYLAAAKALGISSGVGDNKFAPDQAITRQEMFTLLYNALKVLDQLPSGDSGKVLSDFSDAPSIASWAKDAMITLVKAGIISGGDGKLSPEDTTTRTEMAQVLYNLLAK